MRSKIEEKLDRAQVLLNEAKTELRNEERDPQRALNNLLNTVGFYSTTTWETKHGFGLLIHGSSGEGWKVQVVFHHHADYIDAYMYDAILVTYQSQQDMLDHLLADMGHARDIKKLQNKVRGEIRNSIKSVTKDGN